MNESLGHLPNEPIDRFTKPFLRFLRIEATAGAALLLAIMLALVISNSPWANSFHAFWLTPVGVRVGAADFSHSLKHWINDGLMTLFFFLVALELKREIVLGELRNPRVAALSIAGALGGMLVPAVIYVFLARGSAGMAGWGTVMATDTAFVIGCLAILGSRVPLSLRLFLLSLAIFDDIGAIVVVAIGYGEALNGWAVLLAGVGLTVVVGVGRIGVRNMALYSLLGGLIWLAFDASGIHPTLAGVALGLLTPARVWVTGHRLRAILAKALVPPAREQRSATAAEQENLRRARVATREAQSPVEQLERSLHPWVAFAILPVFALANGGVEISPENFNVSVAAAVFAGLVIGKPLGVVVVSFLAVRLGVAAKPAGLHWALIAAGGALTGIGFTMAVFIAELAFDDAMLNSAKIGILAASVVAAAIGLLALAWLTSRSAMRAAP
ncbi:MAG TPA: Na+/H+ antiporter NhaA [Gammaproteobacteria bacterium]|nr:Na+/H+ antiporter NhaA [Gammaproteobacteria bacterium]